MRTVEEIFTDIEKVKSQLPDGYTNTDLCELTAEAILSMFSDIPLDRLREICEAEKDGRCVVLPCKVGDTVYVISHCENVMMNCDDDYETGTGAIECPFEKDCDLEDCEDGNKRIFETTCTGFFVDEDKTNIFFDHINAEFYFSDIGKTVFLTRAEAEAALGKGDAE